MLQSQRTALSAPGRASTLAPGSAPHRAQLGTPARPWRPTVGWGEAAPEVAQGIVLVGSSLSGVGQSLVGRPGFWPLGATTRH